MKVTSRFDLKTCPSCGSPHLAPVPCGMTFMQRMRTVRLGTEWMPSKQASRASGESEYIDDEALKPMFGGLSAKEREEVLMEETKGVGYATREDIEKHPELVAAHYLDNPDNEVEDG